MTLNERTKKSQEEKRDTQISIIIELMIKAADEGLREVNLATAINPNINFEFTDDVKNKIRENFKGDEIVFDVNTISW